MPTARENVIAQVDEMISQGRLGRDMRDNYINMLAGNDDLAKEFSNRLAGGAYFTRRAQEEAENRRREQAAVEAERARLTQWEKDSAARIRELEIQASRYPELQAELAAYKQFVKDNNYGEYIAVKLSETPHQTTPQFHSPQPTQLQQGYLTEEYARGVVGDLLTLQRKAFQISATHQKLFGQPLTDDIIGEAMAVNQDPEQYYRAKYNVAGKEAEVLQAQHEREVAKIREEERSKLMAEYSVDPSRLTGTGNTFPGMEKSTLQSAYMERAAAARNPLVPDGQEMLPPEKRPDLQMAADRVSRASALFSKHFNPDGRATTQEGQALASKHGDFSQ